MRAVLIFVAVLLAAVIGKVFFAFAFPAASMMSVAGAVHKATFSNQLISVITLSGGTFTAGAPAGTQVGTASATMNPATPHFNGTWSLSSAGGGDTTDFAINSSTGIVTTVTPSLCGSPPCSYTITLVATQQNISNSPFHAPATIATSGGLSPPPQAVSGCSTDPTGSCFNTLMFNLDLTGATQSQVNGATFSVSPLSGWWNCQGASSPKFYNYLAGIGVIPCTGNVTSQIISDIDNGPIGTGNSVNVLNVQLPVYPNSGNVSISTTNGGNPPTGSVSPSGFYVEARFRTDSASDASMLAAGNGASMIDVWTFGSPVNGSVYSEWDFIELNAGGDDIAQVRNGCNSCFGPGFNYPSGVSGWNHDVYNTVGYRNTSDGAGHLNACIYVNGTQEWCSGSFTSNNGTADPNVTAEPAQLMFTFSNNPGFGTFGGFMHGYLQYFRAWSCPSWNNVNSSPYNANVCSGILLGTGQ